MSATTPGPVRVLHVTSVTAANPYLNNLAAHIDRDAVHLRAVTLGPPGAFAEALERQGVVVDSLDCSARQRYPRAVRRLTRIAKRERIDIVHTHLFDPTVLGILAAKLRGARLVVTRHHSDALHRIQGAVRRRAYLAIESWISRSVDHIIAPSRMVFDTLTQREGVAPTKITVIPYGQTFERFASITRDQVAQTRADLGMESRFALVCVCRLHAEKGHRYLLEAFASFARERRDARLYLVGEGPERRRLEAAVDRLGLCPHVSFLGWRDDALTILAAADLVVHPSLQEALPSAVIEAVVLERPLVVTDVSGVRDILGDSEPHGTIVAPGNADALLSAIRAVGADPVAAAKRASGGRDRVLSTMDASRVAEAYAECYRRVAALDR